MKAMKCRAIGAVEQDLKALHCSALEQDEKKQDGHTQKKTIAIHCPPDPPQKKT